MTIKNVARQGHLFIVSAPSGGGKTSLVNALIDSDENIEVSVSHTTRPKRIGEQQGKHYFFVSEREFCQMQRDGDFLESAKVFDSLYGTSRKAVEDRIERGTDVVLEIDWQGAEQVRKKWTEVKSIFLIPPSKSELRSRLIGRAQDSEHTIERRMGAAMSELSHYSEFDYLIVNDDFDKALQLMSNVIAAIRRGEAMELPDAHPTLVMVLKES